VADQNRCFNNRSRKKTYLSTIICCSSNHTSGKILKTEATLPNGESLQTLRCPHQQSNLSSFLRSHRRKTHESLCRSVHSSYAPTLCRWHNFKRLRLSGRHTFQDEIGPITWSLLSERPTHTKPLPSTPPSSDSLEVSKPPRIGFPVGDLSIPNNPVNSVLENRWKAMP
jgi:hypothetical protein